jgi:hypothetical protein
VGIQSISNIRRIGGGKKGAPIKSYMKRRIKCVHGYFMPTLNELFSQNSNGFSCPKCDIVRIEDAVKDGKPSKIQSLAIRQNAEASYLEFQAIKSEIKENTFKSHFDGKDGLKPLESSLERFEKAVTRERVRVKEQLDK